MKKLSIYQIFTIICFVLTLTACGSKSIVRPSNGQANIENTRSNEDLLRYYNKQANVSDAERKAYYQLLAAEILCDEAEYQKSARKLRSINRNNLNTVYADRVLIIEARLATIRGQYPLALQKLPEIKDDDPLHVKVRILEARAIALEGAGYALDSVVAYIELGELDPASTKLKQYHQAIWKSLNNIPDIERSQTATKMDSAIYKGWIQLANDIETGRISGYDDAVIIESWKKQHLTHPAYSFADSILLSQQEIALLQPKHIALLLPLNNKIYGASAQAIKDGFLAAYFSEQEKFAGNDSVIKDVQVSIVDINSLPGSIEEKVNSLKDLDVDVVVGPLAKDNVEAILQSKLALPVLTLNQSSADLYNKSTYQFGLIPEHEARQAAELAISRGESRASALYPKSRFGERIFLAFKQRYEELGGQLLSASHYIESASDHKAAIQQSFNIHHSRNRQSILSTVLSRKPEFEPRHRKDIQTVFLVANSVQGRLLKPQLKFHNIIDIPIYSTSRIYAGTSQSNRDRDLNGIVFTETPWLIYKEQFPEYQKIQALWPKTANRYSRLYALGMDAFMIIPHLQRLQSDKKERFNGVSGSVRLNDKQQLERELVWAQFKKGEAELLSFTSLDKNQALESSGNVLPQ